MRLVFAALLVALPLAAESLTIQSKILEEQRTLLVRLPADYTRGEERYPVLHLTDAESQFEHTASTVAFLARANRIPELIVVGVVNTARRRDLTPTAANLPRVYAAIARESPQMRRAFDAFRAKPRATWRTEILTEEDHASIVLPAYHAGLKHVFAPWRFALEELPEDPSKWQAAVREHYANASAFLGWEVKPPQWVLRK